ncbi:dTDP-glucose 4,6-dehydratase [Avrilella dinanensis]|uniref:dTDP-glucose 4,6-dehydratase n=1 Tax=Avrilella dinanensis TaxID=2008672 RepID=A0A2M9R3M9_9FLAO|nr:dTDP-glucose 4,6-dehydratase [Avrilella dinanensis]PJR03461.1 dTDP-glucose 4,6-dehydratase [Avrilella dinanensis]
MKKTILITGGAGFIGSHLVKHFVHKYPDYLIINLDKLTYAGNLENLQSVEKYPNYRFVQADIVDMTQVQQVFKKYNPDTVIHLAAESHVDRSIHQPADFALTNVIGTVNLLNAARETWQNEYQNKLFYQVSTDEVYGTLGEEGLFTEQTPYQPHSPYSASKAGADHFVKAYHDTYGMPVVISNCSNNYGTYQFPEKLIPLCILNILNRKEIPVYGNGKNVRDWLFVGDHAEAIDLICHQGRVGETYNVGGNNEQTNLNLVKEIAALMDKKTGRTPGESESLIRFVKDRPGHDFRYAIDSSKLQNELGWKPTMSFREGLSQTIDWYLDNENWVKHVVSGEYQHYYQKQYLTK